MKHIQHPGQIRALLALLSVAVVASIAAANATARTSSLGPLKVCVYMTVNDTTPTVNVKMASAGAVGHKGAFVLKGSAANLTTHFKVRTNGAAFTSFAVTNAGSQRITVTFGSMSRAINLTLPASTNVKQQAGCYPR